MKSILIKVLCWVSMASICCLIGFQWNFWFHNPMQHLAVPIWPGLLFDLIHLAVAAYAALLLYMRHQYENASYPLRKERIFLRILMTIQVLTVAMAGYMVYSSFLTIPSFYAQSMTKWAEFTLGMSILQTILILANIPLTIQGIVLLKNARKHYLEQVVASIH